MHSHPRRRARAHSRSASARHLLSPRRLRIEHLEERSLLAVLWVDNTPGMAGTEFTSSGGTQPASVAGLTPGVDIFPTISAAIAAAVSGADTINVADGTYTENIVLNKLLTIQGNQFGVDARGRVATETIVSPAVPATHTLEIATGAGASVIDGLTFSGGTRAIETNGGTFNNLQILNNRIVSFTNAGIFLNDPGTDITIDRNVVDGTSKTGGGGIVHLDTDNFNGLHLTNNNIVNASTGTGFFVDGNHNVGPSVNRTPLISGNLIQGNNTGMNLGTRAFGSLTVPNSGTISLNTFAGNNFDGLQGGMQNVLITRNTFSGNGRSGLALTSFGNMGADRGAQNTVITENFFSGNVAEDVFFSASQAVGTISTNTLFNNSLTSTVGARYLGAETIQASGNWWGTNANPEFAGRVVGSIDYTPWLDAGTDTAPGTPGFQGDFSVLNVDDDSPQVGAVLRIQEGVNLVTAGGIVNVHAGTYEELVNVNKTVELRGAQFGVDARDGRASPAGETIVRGALSGMVRTTSFVVAADNVVIDGFQIQETTFANQFGAAIFIQGGSEGTAIRNNIVQDNLVGLFLSNNNLANPAEITQNLFRNNTQPGPASGHSIYADQFTASGGGLLGAVIDSNVFTNTALTVNSWALGLSNTSATPFQQVTFSNNEITNHGRGVYFYNTDDSSITGNTISGVTNYAVGLFNGNDTIAIFNNRLENGTRGVWLSADIGDENTNVSINYNGLVGNTTNLQLEAGSYSGTLDASTNFWGTSDPASVQATFANASAAAIDFTPLVDNDESLADQSVAGFMPDLSALTVHTLGGQAGIGFERIQEGIDEAASGGEVTILAGFYAGDVDATAKAISLRLGAGTSTVLVQVNGNFLLDANDTLRFELDGLAPGTQHDQLAVSGGVVTGGATAAIDRNFIVPIAAELVLIDGQSLISPQFAGLPDDAVVVIDGQAFLVNYDDNDGFDFTLTASDMPPIQIVDGKLLVAGTNKNDKIYVYQKGQSIYVKINGKVHGPFPAASIACVIVYGQDGDDYIEAQSSLKKPVEFHGDAGNDKLLGSKQSDILDGGSGNDTLKGNNGNDSLEGGDGNDTMLGGAGNDSMSGGGGNDTMKGEAGDDRMYGGDGQDKMYGGAGCDVLVGGDHADLLFGDAGNDILIGGLSTDQLKGGANDDILINGTTSYDDGATNEASDAALATLSAEWCKKIAYDTRIANIMSGNLAGGAKLVAECPEDEECEYRGDEAPEVPCSVTVFNDGVRDLLRGEAGRDWFFVVTGQPDFDDLDNDRVAKGKNIERKDPTEVPDDLP